MNNKSLNLKSFKLPTTKTILIDILYKDNNKTNTPSEILSSGVTERILGQESEEVGLSLHGCQQAI